MNMKPTQDLTISAQGVTYKLRPLGFNETASLEEALGETLPMISERASAGSIRHIRGVLWAALLRDQPTMTLEDTGRLLDEMGGLDRLAGMFPTLAPAAPRSAPAPSATRARRRK